MIRDIEAPLKIDSDCSQRSCHFDKDLYQDETPDQLGVLLPPTLTTAVRKRKAEFIAGRYCARQALQQLTDNHRAPIGIGAQREPLWPAGIVGSITHTHGYASAVVASRTRVRAAGIDSETWIEPRTAQDLGERILADGEDHADFRHLFESSRHHLTFVFSAKESLYKSLYPLIGKFFGFQAARIVPEHTASPAGGRFRFELLENLDEEFVVGYQGHGSYAVQDHFVHTAIIIKP